MIPMLDTYRGGYLKALLDVKDMIADRSEIFVWRRRLTKKAIACILRLLDAMIEGRDSLMEYGSAGVTLIEKPDGSLSILKE